MTSGDGASRRHSRLNDSIILMYQLNTHSSSSTLAAACVCVPRQSPHGAASHRGVSHPGKHRGDATSCVTLRRGARQGRASGAERGECAGHRRGPAPASVRLGRSARALARGAEAGAGAGAGAGVLVSGGRRTFVPPIRPRLCEYRIISRVPITQMGLILDVGAHEMVSVCVLSGGFTRGAILRCRSLG